MRGRVAQGEHLGVGRRVAGQLALVVPGGDDHAVVETTAPIGHVAVGERGAGLGEGERHRVDIGAIERIVGCGESTWRREWDSNPRWVAPHTLSKRADSAALASLQAIRAVYRRSDDRGEG